MKIGEPNIKVGRIKASIAREAHIKSADIYIDRNLSLIMITQI